MRLKQPHVPLYRGEGMEAYIGKLTLFLKDFCQEIWTANRMQEKAIDAMERQMKTIQQRMDDMDAER